MDEKTRKDLFSTLNYTSIIGSGVMSFLIAMIVLHYLRIEPLLSVTLSILFSAVITTARIFTDKVKS